MNNIKYWFLQKWYYIEVYFWKLLFLFGVNRSTEGIPKDTPYCYKWDEERNKKEPIEGYWIKPCKYYRHLNGQLRAGCTYVGFIGSDLLLGDQCKICGVNERKQD